MGMGEVFMVFKSSAEAHPKFAPSAYLNCRRYRMLSALGTKVSTFLFIVCDESLLPRPSCFDEFIQCVSHSLLK